MKETFRNRADMVTFLKGLRLKDLRIDEGEQGMIFVGTEYAGSFETLPDKERVFLELTRKYAPATV